jgi:hypothetical protein
MEHHPGLIQIHGDRDPVFPFAYQQDRIHYRLHRATHLALLECQKEVNQILCRLLDEGDRSTTSFSDTREAPSRTTVEKSGA